MSQLTVFSKNGCAGCVAVAQHFDRIGVNYKAVKIDENEAAMAFFRAAGHRSVPQIYTPDGTVLASSLMDVLKLSACMLDAFKVQT